MADSFENLVKLGEVVIGAGLLITLTDKLIEFPKAKSLTELL
jgi:hypothetical protein